MYSVLINRVRPYVPNFPRREKQLCKTDEQKILEVLTSKRMDTTQEASAIRMLQDLYRRTSLPRQRKQHTTPCITRLKNQESPTKGLGSEFTLFQVASLSDERLPGSKLFKVRAANLGNSPAQPWILQVFSPLFPQRGEEKSSNHRTAQRYRLNLTTTHFFCVFCWDWLTKDQLQDRYKYGWFCFINKSAFRELCGEEKRPPNAVGCSMAC